MNEPYARVFLSDTDAIAMLPDGERIHTVRNGALGILVGIDWDRKDLVQAIRDAKERELSGSLATSMGHGLCIRDSHGRLFIETRKDPS